MSASTIDTTPTPTHAVGHYRIDPTRTTVRFSTRHLLGLGAVAGTGCGKDFSVTEPRSATVHAVLDAASFETGNARRDSDVRSAKYLDVTAPRHHLRLPLVRQHEGKWVAAGTSRPTASPRPSISPSRNFATATPRVDLAASAKVDRYAHQVTRPRAWPHAGSPSRSPQSPGGIASMC